MPHAADNMTLCMPFAARETSSLRIVPSSPSPPAPPLIPQNTSPHVHHTTRRYVLQRGTASHWYSYLIKKKLTKRNELHPTDPFQCYPCSNCAYMHACVVLHARPSLHERSCIRELCCMELLVTLCLKIEQRPGMCAILL